MTRLIKKLSEDKSLLSICIVFSLLATLAFLIPLKGVPTLNFKIPLDKLFHGIIYLFLSFLWISYFNKVNNYKKIGTPILIVILLCFFYGIIIEVIQELFIPLRKADIFDVLANMVGTIIGAFLFRNVKVRIKS